MNNTIDPRDRRPQKLAILPGDGIGKDVTTEALKVLHAAASRWSLPLETVILDWDADRYLATGQTMPAGALDDFRQNYSAIFIGAYGDPRVPDMKHAADILLGIRFGLDLYINFRPVKLYDRQHCPLKDKTEKDVDFVVFRENTEGAYVGCGGNFKKGTADEVALQEEVHTRKGVERIIRAAFEWARANGKHKVLMADKSNVMQYGHGLWQRTFAEVKAEYSDIEASHMFADALAMQMVRRPEDFQVIVTNNMFGDILSDLGASLAGGLGLAASANLHPGQTSMFEPVHGSAPKYAGTGKANPLAAILTTALMLDFLGHKEAGAAIESAVASALKANETTHDLGGSLSTGEVGDRIARVISG
ncbi:MAG: 3-isopropylmalate dehydrogenase [Thermoanaerobaculia bacterium]|nr:3-isopropylmalate dehydrogenase [Thermoanaerobaculia bacterium]